MDNLENRARAICAQDLLAAGCDASELGAKVDRLWPIVAREINGGMADVVFAHVADMAERQAEYDALTKIHSFASSRPTAYGRRA